MKNYINGEVPITGNVPIFTDVVISQWNNRCSITSWRGEDFRLYEDSWIAGKRCGGSKITISKEDAMKIISACGLRREQGFFNSSSTYRTAESERDYVSIEVSSYFKMNPGKKPSKFVQNVIDNLNIQL